MTYTDEKFISKTDNHVHESGLGKTYIDNY